MKVLICAGGTGSRVLEAFVHLCAAGLGPAEAVHVLRADSDNANGNVVRCKNLLTPYEACQRNHGTGRLFSTPLILADGGQPWSPVSVTSTLRGLLGRSLGGDCQDIMSLLFTEQELNEELTEGFYGHPAIGAAAISSVNLVKDVPVWSRLIQQIKQATSDNQPCEIALVGSVFGGTGAAMIHPIAQTIREAITDNANLLKITAVVVEPYFRFREEPLDESAAEEQSDESNKKKKSRLAARADRFALAAKAAASYYQFLKKQKNWPFAGMMWVGEKSQREVQPSRGGKSQENDAHHVELLAALAVRAALMNPPKDGECYHASPRQDDFPELQGLNPVGWEDLPVPAVETGNNVERSDYAEIRLMAALTAAVVHTEFHQKLFDTSKTPLARQTHCVPWYYDCFVKQQDTLLSKEAKGMLKHYEDYSERLFRWWQQIHQVEDERTMKLLNRSAWVKGPRKGQVVYSAFSLDALADLKWGETSAVDSSGTNDAVHQFMCALSAQRKRPGQNTGFAAYLALLDLVATKWVSKGKQNKGN